MSNLGVQLFALRVKDLREITRTLDLKGRSSPKTKQALVDFIVRAQQTRIVTKKRILTEIKKKGGPKQKQKTPKRKTPKQKNTSTELRLLVEQRSAVNLKKVASVFGLRVGRKNKSHLISMLILSVDRDALQKEVRKYPVLKKYQKRRKPKSAPSCPCTKWPCLCRTTKSQRKRTLKEETKFRATTFGKLRDYFESAARFKKEMVLECAPYGLSTYELDEDRVALMNINLDAESFERYSCPKAFFIKLSAAQVSKNMKKVLKKDEVTMEVQGKSLVFSIKKSRDGKMWSFSVPIVVEVEYSPLQPPSNESQGYMSMPSNEFYDIARELKKRGPSALFRGSKNRMDIYSDDEGIVFEFENDYAHWEVDEHDQTQVQVEADFEDVLLSTDYLLLFARSKKLSKRIVIKFHSQGLVSFEYWGSEWGRSRITYFLAPMID